MASDAYVCTLSKELREKAETELFEKEEWRNRDIKALRERLLNNKALTCRTDTQFLLMFLRARKFDYERSYKLVENYYKIRAEHIEHFKTLTPSAVSDVLDSGITFMLPKPDKYGRRILYLRPENWDPTKVKLHDVLKANIISIEIALQEEATQINGIVFLNNAEGMGWDLAKHLDRDYFKLETAVFQDGLPVRMKGFHIFNEPSVMSYLLSIVRPFLRSKMASRILVYGTDLERLKTETGLTADVLPAELGGSLPHSDELAKQWKETVMSHEQYFVDQLKYKIVLPRNISSSASSSREVNEMSGISGTFKKLNID